MKYRCALLIVLTLSFFTQELAQQQDGEYFTPAIVATTKTSQFIVYVESVYRVNAKVMFKAEHKTANARYIQSFLANCETRKYIAMDLQVVTNTRNDYTILPHSQITQAIYGSAMAHALNFLCPFKISKNLK